MLTKEHCPICNDDSHLIATVPTINPDSQDITELRECNFCGHWWNSPMPSQKELITMYSDASPYVVPAGGGEALQKQAKSSSFEQFVFSNSSKLSPCNYLEIGIGGGHMLRRFRRMGFNCFGVDPGKWSKDEAVFDELDEVPSEMKFNIYVLKDVIEHLEDPSDIMKKLYSISDDGACLFCSFPCKDSRPARSMREKWDMIRPYGHLHYFSRKSAEMTFSRVGWKINEMRLSRVVPLRKKLLELNLTGLAYEILRGRKDQLYIKASV